MTIDTNKHIFICGETGSGKTYLADWIYKHTNGICVFFNTQLEYSIEQDSDVIVTNLDDFKKAYNARIKGGFLNTEDRGRKYYKICFNSSDDEDIARTQLDAVIDILFKIGYETNQSSEKPKIWCHLFVDETHEYSSKDSRDKTVDRIWRRGRRYGIVGIAVSQRPADVSHGILSQCPTHIIFKVNRYESPYFQRYKIPVFFDNDNPTNRHLNKPYHFAVFSGDSLELYPPVE